MNTRATSFNTFHNSVSMWLITNGLLLIKESVLDNDWREQMTIGIENAAEINHFMLSELFPSLKIGL